MRKETKIGLLAVVTIIIIVIGYNFLKGKSLFSDVNTFYVVYRDVEGLNVTDPVRINGFRIGQIESITMNMDDVRAMTVEMTVDGDIPVPEDASAVIVSTGFLGGKAINLEFGNACVEGNCAESGDFLRSEKLGMLESMIGDPEQMNEYFDIARENIGGLIDSVSSRADTSTIGRTLRNLEVTSANLAIITERFNRLLAVSSSDLSATLDNLNSITGTLEENEGNLASILGNVDSVTADLAAADIEELFSEMEAAIAQLRGTLSTADATISNLDGITAGLEEGEGTLGMLLTEDDLHIRMERTLANLDLLLQDFRQNPKRYVNVSVFGKKQKEYELPEDDPAEPRLPAVDTLD